MIGWRRDGGREGGRMRTRTREEEGGRGGKEISILSRDKYCFILELTERKFRLLEMHLHVHTSRRIYLDWFGLQVRPLKLMIVEVGASQLGLLAGRVRHLHAAKAPQVGKVYIITVRSKHGFEF